MDGKSLDIKQEQLNKLKSLFPEVFSEDKLDLDKLRRTLGEDFIAADERYVLNWAGKADAFRAIQTPTTATLRPQPDQSVNFDTSDNIFIEGENLEVLKVLQKSYYNKIKMIYIDPPYNTGNDHFVYPDKFAESREEYLRRIGDKDEEGYLTKEGFFRKNSKDNGHFHSNWLSMMYPRLFLARNLLRDDGAIFISIDDNEVHNLRLLMNEVFGEENFVDCVVWQKKVSPSNDATWFSSDHDYVLVYAKSKVIWRPVRLLMNDRQKGYYKNPDNDPRGAWNSATYTCNKSRSERPNLYYPIRNPNTDEEVYPRETAVWAYSRELNREHIEGNMLYWGVNGQSRMPRLKKFFSAAGDVVPRSIWPYSEVGHTQEATKDFLSLFPESGFSSPKPVRLMQRILDISTSVNGGDIVLDFFAGSGTTAQAVLESNLRNSSNRKFILVQIPEALEHKGEFAANDFSAISEITKERIRRVINRLSNPPNGDVESDISQLSMSLGSANSLESANVENIPRGIVDCGFKSFALELSNFKMWRTDFIETEADLANQMDAFANPVKGTSEADNMAWEIMLKSGYELTTPLKKLEIDGTSAYDIADGKLLLVLEKGKKPISEKSIAAIVDRAPARVMFLDSIFAENDQLKTNTALQMKDAGVEFETI